MLAVAKGDAGFIFTADGKQLRRIPAVDSTITGLTWSPDGAAIACSCYGGVHVIDPLSGGRLRHLQGKGSMLSLAWSPDGGVITSGCQDNNVHFWRFPQGKDTVLPGTAAQAAVTELERRQPAAGHDRRPRRHGLELRRRGADAAAAGAPGRPPGHGDRGRVRAGRRPAGDWLSRRHRAHLEAARARQTVGVQPLDGQIEALAWGPQADGPLLLAAATAAGSLAVWVIDQSPRRPTRPPAPRRGCGATSRAICRRCTCTSCVDLACHPSLPRALPFTARLVQTAVRLGGAAGRAVRRADLSLGDPAAGRLAGRARRPARLHAHRSARPAVRHPRAGRARSGSPTSSSPPARASARCSASGWPRWAARAQARPRLPPGVDLRRPGARHAGAAGRVRRPLRREPALLVVPDRPGAGDRGGRRRRLQGRHGQGARAPAADGGGPASGRSSTARTWCWSTASCASAATSRRRPRASTSSGGRRAGGERRLTRRGPRLLARPGHVDDSDALPRRLRIAIALGGLPEAAEPARAPRHRRRPRPARRRRLPRRRRAPPDRDASTARVKLTGTPPEMALTKREADPFCAKTPMKDEEVVVGAGGGAQERRRPRHQGRDRPLRPAARRPTVLDQSACMYRPRVQGDRGRADALHPNSDQTLHNVHGYKGPSTLFNQAEIPGLPPIDQARSATPARSSSSSATSTRG